MEVGKTLVYIRREMNRGSRFNCSEERKWRYEWKQRRWKRVGSGSSGEEAASLRYIRQRSAQPSGKPKNDHNGYL